MVIALLLVAVCGVLAAAVFVDRLPVLRRRRHCPVVVTLKSGGGFKGVLADDDARVLVLRNVEAIETKLVAVDGEVIVPWSDVKYLQRL